MEEYYQTRPMASTTTTNEQSNGISDSSSDDEPDPNKLSLWDDFDKYRHMLLTWEEDEGWRSEKRHYLKDMPRDVERDTDIIHWWQVHLYYTVYLHLQQLTSK